MLFTAKVWKSDSAKLDYIYVFLNIFVLPFIVAVAIVSAHFASVFMLEGMVAAFGAREVFTLPDWAVGGIILFATFMAYELAYWLDHYLSHKIPFLWEFHKVHHSAAVLTPLTNLRIHPVDAVLFYNIKALLIGGTYGLVAYLMGREVIPLGENILLFIFAILYGYLQHSHVWIPFTGLWGKVFLSPAHHQIHHSSAPEHFDKNFGGNLAVFDWMFGTLHMPSKKRQKLVFGVNGQKQTPRIHQLDYSLFNPFVRVGKRFHKQSIGLVEGVAAKVRQPVSQRVLLQVAEKPITPKTETK
ncbi:MAG: sterol desaturase family protein [Alphaproteobacteria bacterium]|nr:sterol desaturase family protein [Alphaproteobacteria bacterium]